MSGGRSTADKRYTGSALKGIGCSLLCQLMAVIGAAMAMGGNPGNSPVLNRRQFWGTILLCLWGVTQWVLAVPAALYWGRRSETRTVKWLCGTSLACAAPSLLILGMAVFGRLLNLYREMKYR